MRSRLLLEILNSCAQRDNGQTSVFLHRRDRKFAFTCKEQGVNPSSSAVGLPNINRFSESDTDQNSIN